MHFSQYQFVIICANNIKLNFYKDLIRGFNVELQFNKDIFPFVDAAVVASGTASLELAMYNIPQVVCYKLNPISFLFAKLFSRVKYISLVNILADQPIVEELIQHRCNAINIESSLKSILEENNRKKIRLGYKYIIGCLGDSGCFKKISKFIYSNLHGIKKQPSI